MISRSPLPSFSVAPPPKKRPPAKPDFSLEKAAAHPVAGVDEAGRGPWAGPVVAAAVILDPKHLHKGIDDSKKLKPQARDTLYETIMHTAQVGVGQASVEEIDTLNILAATMLAMQRAVAALPALPALALIDGNRLPALACPAKFVIRGDALSLSIAAASIIAKVTRDRLMTDMARDWPHYGFERHFGYGTPHHQSALATHGPCPHHRRSFAPIAALLAAREEEAA